MIIKNNSSIQHLFLALSIIFFSNCDSNIKHREFSSLIIKDVVKDSTLNVRAIDFNDEYLFYGSQDHFAKINLNEQVRIDLDKFEISQEGDNQKFTIEKEDGSFMHFRAVEIAGENIFTMSIENPARIYKLHRKSTTPRLVYEENHPKAFYDAMAFWNENEGLAIGDPTEDCMSILITRDSGENWQKLSCDLLPKTEDGEAAFAASDTNIAIVGDHTWIATSGKKSRVLYSSDKGKSWEIFNTPIIQGKPTTGLYSIDFYDQNHGFGIGGDYTSPEDNKKNKVITNNGGKTWKVVAENKAPGYRSCVQYIPNSEAKALVAVGFEGISYSKDAGENWIQLSDESFYTLKFINESEAFAAGKGRISKLIFY